MADVFGDSVCMGCPATGEMFAALDFGADSGCSRGVGLSLGLLTDLTSGCPASRPEADSPKCPGQVPLRFMLERPDTVDFTLSPIAARVAARLEQPSIGEQQRKAVALDRKNEAWSPISEDVFFRSLEQDKLFGIRSSRWNPAILRLRE